MKSFSEKIRKNLDSKTNTYKTNSQTSSYLDSKKNIENLINLKINLKEDKNHSNLFKKFESSYEIFNKENLKISEIFKDEENIINKLNQDSSKYRLNDFVFEEKTIKILSEKFNLKEYDLFPYFDISLSSFKDKKMIKIYYYKAQILIDNKKLTLLFLNDREIFMTSFEDITFIFEKYKEAFNSVTVISKDFNCYTDFEFKKEGQKWTTNFLFADINLELMEIKNQIREIKNKIESTTDDQKENLKEKLESYNKIYEIIKEKYSEKNISYEIKRNSNKIKILEEKYKLNDKKIIDYEKKKKKLNKKINDYKNLLKQIRITITKKDKEFDGLFVTSKEIEIKNILEESLIIPAKKPIIVEVKNNSNYYSLLENIKNKKVFMENLGIKSDNFYFIGILKDLNINLEEKKIIDQKIKNFNFKNVIIICPQNLNFLGSELYKAKKEKENEENYTIKDVIKMIKDLQDQMNNIIERLPKEKEK